MDFITNIITSETIAWTYLLAFLTLAILWATEHFFIQESLFKVPPITLHPIFYRLTRMLINLSAAFLLLIITNRELLLGIIILDLIFSVVVLTYQQYFQRPFSLFLAIRHIREGIKVFSFATRIIPWGTRSGLIVILAIKIILALMITSPSNEKLIESSWVTVGIPLAILCGTVVFLQFTSFRFDCIRNSSITRAIYVYGYSISWVADFFMVSSIQKAAREEAILQTPSPDRLDDVEVPWTVKGNVVIIQIESLCYNMLNCSMNGKEVTPFLNQLARNSHLFKLQAYHAIGTVDMDYALLSGNLPSKHMVTYSIPDLDYTNALPHFMHQHGYRSMSLHGVTGEYYNRRTNFERMGWDEICFREEFTRINAKESYWGVRDMELLNHSLKRMQDTNSPEFHFIITLDSHGPFNLISENEKTIFPGSLNWKANYFNSMSTVDRNLSEYVAALPAGTLLILYGDHTSGVSYQGFMPARENLAEYVPCIIHVCSDPGTEATPPKNLTNLPKDLSIHDIINCLRRKIEAG